MKHITIFIMLIVLYFVSTLPAFSQEKNTTPEPTKGPTISSSDTTSKLDKQINSLKDRIASRVAELDLVDKRGAVGTVVSISSTQMTLSGPDNKNVLIDIDPITKFSSLDNDKDFGVSDIKKGMKMSVLGLYNKQSKRLQARFVDQVTIPTFVRGTVASVDEKGGTITVAIEGEKSTDIDIETVTKTSKYVDGEIEKSGFSEIEVGQRVVVQGYPDKTDSDKVIATRVLIFPDLPKNPKIVVPDETMQKEKTTPTTTGKKASPTASE